MSTVNIKSIYEHAKLATATYTILDTNNPNHVPLNQSITENPALLKEYLKSTNAQNRLPTWLAKQVLGIKDKDENGQVTFDPADTGAIPWEIPAGGYWDNDNYGFAATVYQRDHNGTTETVLAIRGTEPDQQSLHDLAVSDLFIGGLGFAFDQAVSMVNAIEKMKVAKGVEASVTQFKFGRGTDIPEGAKVVANAVQVHPDFPEYYWVQAYTETVTGSGLLAESDTNLTVTGHSLGGHFATAFSRLFPI